MKFPSFAIDWSAFSESTITVQHHTQSGTTPLNEPIFSLSTVYFGSANVFDRQSGIILTPAGEQINEDIVAIIDPTSVTAAVTQTTTNTPVPYGLGSAVVTAAVSVTVALTQAPAVGDILTVVIGAYDPTAISITPPSGWNLVQHYTSGSGFSESACFQKVATLADVTSYSYAFTLGSASSAARAVIFGVTNATVDSSVSSITATVSGGLAPIQGSGQAETASANELLVVFATSTRATSQSSAPTISPALASIGAIPFATDGSLTPAVAGWQTTASFSTPTVVIDPSNPFNQSLVGVITLGFKGVSVTTTIGNSTSGAYPTICVGDRLTITSPGDGTTQHTYQVTHVHLWDFAPGSLEIHASLIKAQ